MTLGVKCLAHSVNSGNAIPFSGQMFYMCQTLFEALGKLIRIKQSSFSQRAYNHHNHIFQANLCSHIIFPASSLHIQCSMRTNLVWPWLRRVRDKSEINQPLGPIWKRLWWCKPMTDYEYMGSYKESPQDRATGKPWEASQRKWHWNSALVDDVPAW